MAEYRMAVKEGRRSLTQSTTPPRQSPPPPPVTVVIVQGSNNELNIAIGVLAGLLGLLLLAVFIVGIIWYCRKLAREEERDKHRVLPLAQANTSRTPDGAPGPPDDTHPGMPIANPSSVIAVREQSLTLPPRRPSLLSGQDHQSGGGSPTAATAHRLSRMDRAGTSHDSVLEATGGAFGRQSDASRVSVGSTAPAASAAHLSPSAEQSMLRSTPTRDLSQGGRNPEELSGASQASQVQSVAQSTTGEKRVSTANASTEVGSSHHTSCADTPRLSAQSVHMPPATAIAAADVVSQSVRRLEEFAPAGGSSVLLAGQTTQLAAAVTQAQDRGISQGGAVWPVHSAPQLNIEGTAGGLHTRHTDGGLAMERARRVVAESRSGFNRSGSLNVHGSDQWVVCAPQEDGQRPLRRHTFNQGRLGQPSQEREDLLQQEVAAQSKKRRGAAMRQGTGEAASEVVDQRAAEEVKAQISPRASAVAKATDAVAKATGTAAVAKATGAAVANVVHVAAPAPVADRTSLGAVKEAEWDLNKEVAALAQSLNGPDTTKLKLIDLIGQGAHGSVYRGVWRNLEVAVKTVMFSDRMGMSTGVTGSNKNSPKKRAIMEAAVCTSMMHPNVVCTYHYDITPIRDDKTGRSQTSRLQIEGSSFTRDYKLYLVQEYCDASLHAVLGAHILHDPSSRKPNMDLVLTVLLDIARGMEYIHQKNIIHGDLKPENVLLKNDVQSPIGVVGKVTDFGLSATLNPGDTHLSNMANGTPFYSAPEVVSAGKVTRASDIYSFGVLMWETYRCMPPWVRTKTGYTANPRFRRFPADSPLPFVLLCAQCLDKSPKARPNFQTILEALKLMHTAFMSGYSSLMRSAGQSSRAAENAIASAAARTAASAGMVVETNDGLRKGWYHGMASVVDLPPATVVAAMGAVLPATGSPRLPTPPLPGELSTGRREGPMQALPAASTFAAATQGTARVPDVAAPAARATLGASVSFKEGRTVQLYSAASSSTVDSKGGQGAALSQQQLAALSLMDQVEDNVKHMARAGLRSDALARWLHQAEPPGVASDASAQSQRSYLSSPSQGKKSRGSTHAAPENYGSEQHLSDEQALRGNDTMIDADSEVLKRLPELIVPPRPRGSKPEEEQASSHTNGSGAAHTLSQASGKTHTYTNGSTNGSNGTHIEEPKSLSGTAGGLGRVAHSNSMSRHNTTYTPTTQRTSQTTELSAGAVLAAHQGAGVATPEDNSKGTGSGGVFPESSDRPSDHTETGQDVGSRTISEFMAHPPDVQRDSSSTNQGTVGTRQMSLDIQSVSEYTRSASGVPERVPERQMAPVAERSWSGTASVPDAIPRTSAPRSSMRRPAETGSRSGTGTPTTPRTRRGSCMAGGEDSDADLSAIARPPDTQAGTSQVQAAWAEALPQPSGIHVTAARQGSNELCTPHVVAEGEEGSGRVSTPSKVWTNTVFDSPRKG